jgi:heat shock protein HtpX
MKWDLWNPWALYYQLNSTHPLIAKRLDRLSEQSVYMGKAPYVVFDHRRPECYWDEFFTDLFIMLLPIAACVLAAALFYPMLAMESAKFWSTLAIAFGASYSINTLFGYASWKEYPEMSVSSLLKDVKVSAIRPVPCTIKGRIIGRGIPGLIWSEDFVLQDETGVIFLDFRQPLGIWEFLFGLLRAKKYINETVTVTGWYRRSPVPYIELKTLTDSSGKTLRSYVYYVKLTVSILFIAGGFVFFLI